MTLLIYRARVKWWAQISRGSVSVTPAKPLCYTMGWGHFGNYAMVHPHVSHAKKVHMVLMSVLKFEWCTNCLWTSMQCHAKDYMRSYMACKLHICSHAHKCVVLLGLHSTKHISWLLKWCDDGSQQSNLIHQSTGWDRLALKNFWFRKPSDPLEILWIKNKSGVQLNINAKLAASHQTYKKSLQKSWEHLRLRYEVSERKLWKSSQRKTLWGILWGFLPKCVC